MTKLTEEDHAAPSGGAGGPGGAGGARRGEAVAGDTAPRGEPRGVRPRLRPLGLVVEDGPERAAAAAPAANSSRPEGAASRVLRGRDSAPGAGPAL